MRAGCDALIVGAGSAGCVLASRLSEDPSCSVVLVEAGGEAIDPDIADPRQWPFLAGRSYDWAYRTTPQAGTNGRVHDWPRGRILGGSSCLNAMAHVRGHADDFDAWAAVAGPRWSYRSLLPAFRRSERFSAGGEERGDSGPLDVWLPDTEVHPVVRAYMAAGISIGAPRLVEHNAGPLAGVAPNQLTVRNGLRHSAADAYLAPCRHRPNLTVITDAHVERLALGTNRATGLQVCIGGKPEFLAADRIVLCAGAIGSPLLLMRSGIGDPAELRAASVACLAANPAIGRNLHDHLLAGVVYASREPLEPSRLQHSESLMYLHADDPGRADGVPDVAIACVVLPVVTERFARPAVGSAYTLLCGVTHPTSRGTIRLSGPAADDAPIIDPAYLATEFDRKTFRSALRLARRVGEGAALDAWRKAELLPGPNVESDADIDAFLADAVMTHHHPVGTCRMGLDDGSAVDGELRLRGFDNVFVVDASVIPSITTGPINAAVVAIAEHWASGFEELGARGGW